MSCQFFVLNFVNVSYSGILLPLFAAPHVSKV